MKRYLYAIFATATSDTHVCNVALGLIGVGRIANIDGTTPVERDCKTIYADARDEVLAGYSWRFAGAEAILARVSVVPLDGFSFSYQLPSDSLNPIRLSNPQTNFKIVGDLLYCDLEEDVILEYTKRIEDASKFSAKFTTLLAHRLSAPLAMMVKKDRKLSEGMWNLYNNMVKAFEPQDAKADNTEVPEINSYVDARLH